MLNISPWPADVLRVGKPKLDRKWIVSKAIKANRKKYLKIRDGWQFDPVYKKERIPRAAYVAINKEAVKEAAGEFHLEWRSDGKRHQVPCRSCPRAALDAWRAESGILNGTIDFDPEEMEIPASKRSVRSAFEQIPTETEAKKKNTYRAYRNDVQCISELSERHLVSQVTREEILHLLSIGREEGLGPATINRRAQTGLRALRNAGSTRMS